MKQLNEAYSKGDAEAIGNLVRQWETSPYAVGGPPAAGPAPALAAAVAQAEQRLAETRDVRPRTADGADVHGLHARAGTCSQELRWQAEAALADAREPRRAPWTSSRSSAARRGRSPGSVRTTRRIATRSEARTWMAWLLLAVFVAARRAPPPWLWRGQVKRQNDQAFAAQAASIGASVTTAVRRMDDLTLAARTLLGSRPEMTDEEFNGWYRSMGVDQRFARRRRLQLRRARARAAARTSTRRAPPLLLPAQARRRRSRHVRDARRDDGAGPRPLPAHQAARRDARLRRVQRLRRHAPATATRCSR